MFDRISIRAVSVVLVSTAALLTACVPDECDVNFAYTATRGGISDVFQYVWRHPTTDCYLGSGVGAVGGGTSMFYENGIKSLMISLPVGGLQPGPHSVQISYSDDDGRVWITNPGGLPGALISGCVALVEEVEQVDWVRDDHLRISGVVQCPGPLIRATYSGAGQPDTLQFSELRFNIYSSSLGLL